MDDHPRSAGTLPDGLWPTLAVAAVALVFAGLLGFSAGISPNNCGELPGITRAATTVLVDVVAGGIFFVGLIVAAASRRSVGLGRAVILALALIVGVQLGTGVAGVPAC